MTLLLDRRGVSDTGDFPKERRNPRQFSGVDFIDIALVNNMPDTAMKATEQQFIKLLEAGAGAANIRLHCFSLPQLPRSDISLSRIEKLYVAIDDLRRMKIDGLIVTGAEPRAASLTDELYWEAFSGLIDWAAQHTRSAIWSCLAAHAAVLHLDSVARRRLTQKCSGVYSCKTMRTHWMTGDAGTGMTVPHSRLNALDPGQLIAKGYDILSFSEQAGVDVFTKSFGSEFIFFQGHPEYDVSALQREYLRDVGRYLNGTQPNYPEMPENYFDAGSAAQFEAFRTIAKANRDPAMIEQAPVPVLRDGLADLTAATARTLFTNWIARLADRKRAAA
jgi:homoserine O-succinyltransferase